MNKKSKKKQEEEEELPGKEDQSSRLKTNDKTVFKQNFPGRSHTVPRHVVHRAGTRRRHNQQGLRVYRRGQSRPHGSALAGSAGWEERLPGRISGELRVPRIRRGGDQKG